MFRNNDWRFKFSFLLLSVLFATNAFAQNIAKEANASLYPGFPRCAESRAFQQFQKRPMTELSKLVYMCDRLFDSKIEILYENQYYTAQFSASAARVFVATHYRQEKAEDWIKRWVTTSFPSGKPVWAKLPDGSFKIAKDILLTELKELNGIVAEKKN